MMLLEENTVSTTRQRTFN